MKPWKWVTSSTIRSERAGLFSHSRVFRSRRGASRCRSHRTVARALSAGAHYAWAGLQRLSHSSLFLFSLCFINMTLLFLNPNLLLFRNRPNAFFDDASGFTGRVQNKRTPFYLFIMRARFSIMNILVTD